MTSILNLCSWVILLNSGLISQCGQASQVVPHYLNINQEANVFRPRSSERRGSQSVRIEGFRLHPVPPQTGMPLDFIFDIYRPESVREDLPVELAVTILTDQGVKLLQLYSRHMNVVFHVPTGRAQVVARLESLPLAPGSYWINLWMGAGETLFDWHPECLLLSVVPGHFSTGAFVDNRGYPILLPSSWHLISDDQVLHT